MYFESISHGQITSCQFSLQYHNASLLQTAAALVACQILMVQHPLLLAAPAGQDRLGYGVDPTGLS